MNRWLLAYLLFISCYAQVFAQEFTGYVKSSDTVPQPIYRALVLIRSESKHVDSLRTYFNGSFKFTTYKNQTYHIRISYPGYLDTTFAVLTDKNAVPKPSGLTVYLKKNGMRLLGFIKSAGEGFPLKGATVVLKNVMTWKEERTTTGIDGYYNFKLEYETNYRVSIDKRSRGIWNKYEDTAFYVSTIGFNQPLDYRLDIFLNDATSTDQAKLSYDEIAQPDNRNEKPVVTIQTHHKEAVPTLTKASEPKPKNTEDSISAYKPEIKQPEKEAAAGKKKKPGHVSAPVSRAKKTKSKSKKKDVEVEVIPDRPVTPKPRAAVIDTATNRVVSVPAVIHRDSFTRAVAIEEKVEKAHQDSSTRTIVKQRQATKEPGITKNREDSVSKASIQKRENKEQGLKKLNEDSIARVLAKGRKMHIEDSLAIVKAEQERQARVAAWEKKRLSDEAVVARKKAIEDSLANVKAAKKLKAQQLVLKKASEDSVAKMLQAERRRAVADSLQQLKQRGQGLQK